VFGHHPHLLQGIEVHNGRAIFYSLGNFTFARHRPHKGHEYETGMVRCRIRDGRICAVDFLPARCDESLDPRVLDVEEGRDVVELIKTRSADFGTAFVESGDSLRVVADARDLERSKAA
jgi:poly-gamma-glutamate synthesis protein (capsule biosynthesis protein)